jgi:hypothetical protein
MERWKIILKWIVKEVGLDGVQWIRLARDRNNWRAVLNRVTNRQVS